ncbi:uncharacterized protein [Paramisgurnus dabryanus]|uniref:uncharacterized protein n=1 Tax=Paramisgurnus dabryanus TaxID=90735 RepID=UPI0031F4038E
MSTKHHLTVLFFCGFNLLAVSAQICGSNLVEGQSCIIKLEKKSGETINTLEWIFTSSIDTKTHKAQQKGVKTINNIPDATIQSDGLKLQNVKLNNTGKYRYEIYDDKGKKTAGIEKEITVYAKVTKPNVKSTCVNGTATLTCDIKINDKRGLTITWIQEKPEKKEMKGESNLIRTSKQIEENADYSCRAQNPVSKEQSDVKTISCGVSFLGPGGKLFGIDFWIMIGILAGGGTLLLLLIVVLVVCACRSCNKREKMQEEEELRLRSFPSPTPPNQHRSKNTARGQPAPPIPQEDSSQNGPTTQTPPQTRAQPKAQVRARPPPPPQDEDEEDPPPLPQPRKKREKRHQEPYRPME